MIEDRDLFERAVQRFVPTAGSFDRLASRRDRKRRNKRIAAGIVGILVAIAGFGAVLRAIEADRGMPVAPEPSLPKNGDVTFVSDKVVDFSDNLSDFSILYTVDPVGGEPKKLLDVGCLGRAGSTPCEDTVVRSIDWSPDGTHLAFATSGSGASFGGRAGIYVLDAKTLDLRQITSCTRPCVFQDDVDWSPDGSRIAYSQANGSGCDRMNEFRGSCAIFTMDPDGTNREKLPTGAAVDPVGPSWSPDGTHVAFSARVHEDWFVYTMAVDGSELTRLAGDLHPSPEQTQPSWSPDGSSIAFITWEGADEGREPTQLDAEHGLPLDLWAIAPDGSGLRHLYESCCLFGGAGFSAQGPEWSPDGTRVLFSGGTGGRLELIDPETKEVAVTPGEPSGPIAWQPVP